MDFILNKLLLVFILSNVYLGTDFDLPRHDLLILNNGEEIKCQVQSITDGLVKVTANDGERTIIREMNINAARDMVEAGIIKTTRYSGRLVYLDTQYLELNTSSGVVRVEKAKIRKIIISQEPALNL